LTYIKSQKYWKAKTDGNWGGAMNVWFDHKEEIEITDVSSQGNQQPFLLNTVDGLKWTVSTEPWGAANGIFRIYVLDARTGDITYKKFSGTEIGPVNACDYAKKNHPEVDWSQFHVVEPIPVTPDGILFWEVRVVPDDGSGISYVAFVDPKTGATVEFTKDKEIVAFLHGAEVPTDNQTNTTKYTYITGTVTDIDVFVQDGNTRWIMDITGGNKSNYFIAKAELLNLIIIEILSDVKIGDNVTAMIGQNNILMAIKIN
jgi:hypothetical protein